MVNDGQSPKTRMGRCSHGLLQSPAIAVQWRLGKIYQEQILRLKTKSIRAMSNMIWYYGELVREMESVVHICDLTSQKKRARLMLR